MRLILLGFAVGLTCSFGERDFRPRRDRAAACCSASLGFLSFHDMLGLSRCSPPSRPGTTFSFHAVLRLGRFCAAVVFAGPAEPSTAASLAATGFSENQLVRPGAAARAHQWY